MQLSKQDLLPLLTDSRLVFRRIFLYLASLFVLVQLLSRATAVSDHAVTPHISSFQASAEPFSEPSTAQLKREAGLRDILADQRIVWFTARGTPNSDTLLPVTAILVHWRRRRSLEFQLEALSLHPFIQEIIVWNNNPAVHLKRSDLLNLLGKALDRPVLRIFNAPSFLGDQAIITACTLASHSTCYYNHDNIYNPNLDALFLKYIDTEPKKRGIVESVNEEAYWKIKHLQFENLIDVDLHAAFTPLRSSFFPKAFAARFLSQQASTQQTLSREVLASSSLFFGIYTNAYPQFVRFTIFCCGTISD